MNFFIVTKGEDLFLILRLVLYSKRDYLVPAFIFEPMFPPHLPVSSPTRCVPGYPFSVGYEEKVTGKKGIWHCLYCGAEGSVSSLPHYILCKNLPSTPLLSPHFSKILYIFGPQETEGILFNIQHIAFLILQIPRPSSQDGKREQHESSSVFFEDLPNEIISIIFEYMGNALPTFGLLDKKRRDLCLPFLSQRVYWLKVPQKELFSEALDEHLCNLLEWLYTHQSYLSVFDPEKYKELLPDHFLERKAYLPILLYCIERSTCGQILDFIESVLSDRKKECDPEENRQAVLSLCAYFAARAGRGLHGPLVPLKFLEALPGVQGFLKGEACLPLTRDNRLFSALLSLLDQEEQTFTWWQGPLWEPLINQAHLSLFAHLFAVQRREKAFPKKAYLEAVEDPRFSVDFLKILSPHVKDVSFKDILQVLHSGKREKATYVPLFNLFISYHSLRVEPWFSEPLPRFLEEALSDFFSQPSLRVARKDLKGFLSYGATLMAQLSPPFLAESSRVAVQYAHFVLALLSNPALSPAVTQLPWRILEECQNLFASLSPYLSLEKLAEVKERLLGGERGGSA